MMMRSMLTAAAMAALGTGVGAATVAPGYTWAADDGSLSMFVGVEPGEDFLDLIEEGWRLTYAAGIMLVSSFVYFEAGPESVGGELYRDKIGEDVEVEGGTCHVNVHNIYGANIGYASGALTYNFLRSVRGVSPNEEGTECSTIPGDEYLVGDPIAGTWAALSGAPAFPFGTEEPSPVPVPSSASLALIGLAGLCVLRRRRAV